MAPSTAKTHCAATGQTSQPQHRNLPDAATPDTAALAKTGQKTPPQRHNVNSAATTDNAVVAEHAACVGRVCSQGSSISQARSAQDSGQSHPNLFTYIER